MKNSTLVLVMFLLMLVQNVRGQAFDWARQAGYHSSEAAHSVTADADGNCYIAGEMSPQTSFGSITFGGSFVDGFVAKYNPAGDLLWATNITGPDTESPYQISSDPAGNTYVTGTFNQTATLGALSVSATGGYDAFIARYDSSGNPLWVKKAGGPSAEYGSGVFADAQGNVFVCGAFYQTINFGSQTLTSAGMDDVFIAKYDSSGTFKWAVRAGGPGADYANDIIVSDGRIYIAGAFQQTASFGSASVTSSGHYDIFLACYDTSGNAIWSNRAGSSEFLGEAASSVTVDISGRIYISGSAGGTASFGNHTITSNGGGSYSDAFIAAYDTTGSCLWVRNGGGITADGAMSVAADQTGMIYMTGSYNAVATFGPFQLQPISQSSDIFLACYDSNGIIQWVKRAGGGYGPDAGEGLCYDHNGGLYLAGFFYRSASFDAVTLPWIYHERNIFVAHLGLNPQVGLTDIPASRQQLILSPNPVSSRLNITIKDDKNSILTVTVFDESGRKVYASAPVIPAVNDCIVSVDVSQLDPGLYFCRVDASGKAMNSRFIVAR